MGKVLSKRISGGTFFKLLLIGSVVTHIVLVLTVMVGVLIGWFEPTHGDEPMSKLDAELFLAAYLIIGASLTPIWAGIFWIGLYPGIWLYSKLKPMEIYYKESGK